MFKLLVQDGNRRKEMDEEREIGYWIPCNFFCVLIFCFYNFCSWQSSACVGLSRIVFGKLHLFV